jgi:uncharacterized membrane protein YvbJ
MKCSKCGFDNAENAIFCEKCDWKLGETYIPEMKVNKSIFNVITLIVGIAAAALALFEATNMVGMILGAVGLVLGGYSFNVPRLMNAENKNMLMLMSGIGMILSVFAFIYGIYQMVA